MSQEYLCLCLGDAGDVDHVSRPEERGSVEGGS